MPLADGDYPYSRYLAAKKQVDDRALNQNVWRALAEEVSALHLDRHVRVLEVGAGIGTMVERVVDRGLLRAGEYTLVEKDLGNLAEVVPRLGQWSRARGFTLHWQDSRNGRLEMPAGALKLALAPADVYDFVARTENSGRWDLLIAHAFMDLVDMALILPGLCTLLAPAGLLYLSLNYDGETIFLPPLPGDPLVLALYNRSMDQRSPHGRPPSEHCKTGRRLFLELARAGASLIAAGSSDWLVFPKDGNYSEDEKFFLQCIVHTIARELRNHPALPCGDLDKWVAGRLAQIEAGELIYSAKQFDFLARARAAKKD